ncbi:hypothetical protein M9H77_22266 [Catharanthus roseus]|uniref:Uncharacterized protein n=1 Tax=Catharanthus roseus TaxID=4058 RepID=A0ACC0ASK9_CATRO|nr:hypothetical protein M9H77_22266 [Catharanthus roseus]
MSCWLHTHYNTRCSAVAVKELVNQLNEAQRVTVIEMWFGSLLKVDSFHFPPELFSSLVEYFDSNELDLKIHGKSIPIIELEVHHILRLPFGEIDIDSLLFRGKSRPEVEKKLVKFLSPTLKDSLKRGWVHVIENVKELKWYRTLMSSFIAPAHQARENVGVGADLDEIRDEKLQVRNLVDTSTDEDVYKVKMSMNVVKKKLLLNNISIADHLALLEIMWNDKLPSGERIVKMKRYFVIRFQMESFKLRGWLSSKVGQITGFMSPHNKSHEFFFTEKFYGGDIVICEKFIWRICASIVSLFDMTKNKILLVDSEQNIGLISRKKAIVNSLIPRQPQDDNFTPLAITVFWSVTGSDGIKHRLESVANRVSGVIDLIFGW